MNPYKLLTEKYFWSPAIAQRNMFEICDLWDPKFNISPSDKVATFGSCFAQHFGNALKTRGFSWFISESGPAGLSAETLKKYNYGVFTARTGNIYTTSLLKQWIKWATKEKKIPEEIWESNGRYFDPFRPRIEPNGFQSIEELRLSRQTAVASFMHAIENSDVFVFTLGLTESWINKELDYEYPMCPGTAAGDFNSSKHKFVNQDYYLIRNNLAESLTTIKSINPKIKIILTVSPVPLTATMSGNHVLVATMESKSILRAVAGKLSRNNNIDYFPSYEIINSAPFKGVFFEPNMRSISKTGVNHVMNLFFQSLSNKFPKDFIDHNVVVDVTSGNRSSFDVECDEAILDGFSK